MPDAATEVLARRLERIESIEEIRQLKMAYCRCVDTGWDGAIGNAHQLGKLFTDDAVWVAPRARLDGREEIEAWFTTHLSQGWFGVHVVGGSVIEVDGDEATGWWYAVVPMTTPDGEAVWTVGAYDEQYRRVVGRWYISTLSFTPAFQTPYEKGWASVRFLSDRAS